MTLIKIHDIIVLGRRYDGLRRRLLPGQPRPKLAPDLDQFSSGTLLGPGNNAGNVQQAPLLRRPCLLSLRLHAQVSLDYLL